MKTSIAPQVQQFYRYSSDWQGVGLKCASTCDAIGPVLEKTLSLLADKGGLQVRSSFYSKEGAWSGDLYATHRRLFALHNEKCFFMGHSGTQGDNTANVYEFALNSANGSAHCLSVLLRGAYDPSLAQALSDHDFAPKHNYLGKDSLVLQREKGVWLETLVDIPSLPDLLTH